MAVGRSSLPATLAVPRPRRPASRRAGGELLLDRVRGDGPALALARTLLADTWVVESIEELPEAFSGIAVTRSGRVWSARSREVRQAAGGRRGARARRAQPPPGTDREERAAPSRPSIAPRGALAEATERSAAVDTRLRGGDRGAPRGGPGARRGGRGGAADRRPDPAPALGARRRSQRAAGGPSSTAELMAERGAVERAERERAERMRRIERLQASVARDDALVPAVAAVITALTGPPARSPSAGRRSRPSWPPTARPASTSPPNCAPAPSRRRTSTVSCTPRTSR